MSATSFPLPPPTQEKFTRWFGKTVPGADETIVYPGEQLPCSTKSRTLKSKIRPRHVFITQKADGGFRHRILGDDNVFATLPKRLFSVCFPKIHVANVPTNNRVTLHILDTRELTLPFIPDEFHQQKLAKAERSAPTNRRNKRRRAPTPARNQDYRGWAALRARHMTNAANKHDLCARIKTILDRLDAANVVPHNPFQTCSDDDLATVVQFIYHYARGEMRMTRATYDPAPLTDDLWQHLVNRLTDVGAAD